MKINLHKLNLPNNLIHYTLKKPEITFKRNSDYVNSEFKLSIMSWNILANGYSSPSVYHYVDPKYLNEIHRYNMILYDLKKFNTDIVCLQEVEKFNFDKLTNSFNNYNGIYTKRPGLTCDGLATFYKKDFFKLVKHINLDLNNLSVLSKSLLRNAIRTNNIAQILYLEPINEYIKKLFDIIVIVNLHLHWDPNMELLKYLQMSEIMNTLHKSTDFKDPVLLCGDFNSLPDSTVIDLIKNKFNDYKLYKEELTTYKYIYNSTKKINFIDSHEGDKNYDTNIKNDFEGKLDYIFISDNQLLNKFESSFIDKEIYKSEIGLPNSFHGSDHIYLITNFYL